MEGFAKSTTRKGMHSRRTSTSKKGGDGWDCVKLTSTAKKGRKTFNNFENKSTHNAEESSKAKIPDLPDRPPSPESEKPISTTKKGRKSLDCTENKSTPSSNENIVSDGEYSDDYEIEPVHDHSACCHDQNEVPELSCLFYPNRYLPDNPWDLRDLLEAPRPLSPEPEKPPFYDLADFISDQLSAGLPPDVTAIYEKLQKTLLGEGSYKNEDEMNEEK